MTTTMVSVTQIGQLVHVHQLVMSTLYFLAGCHESGCNTGTQVLAHQKSCSVHMTICIQYTSRVTTGQCARWHQSQFSSPEPWVPTSTRSVWSHSAPIFWNHVCHAARPRALVGALVLAHESLSLGSRYHSVAGYFTVKLESWALGVLRLGMGPSGQHSGSASVRVEHRTHQSRWWRDAESTFASFRRRTTPPLRTRQNRPWRNQSCARPADTWQTPATGRRKHVSISALFFCHFPACFLLFPSLYLSLSPLWLSFYLLVYSILGLSRLPFSFPFCTSSLHLSLSLSFPNKLWLDFSHHTRTTCFGREKGFGAPIFSLCFCLVFVIHCDKQPHRSHFEKVAKQKRTDGFLNVPWTCLTWSM